MFWAHDTSAATASHPSAQHHANSANAPDRRSKSSATHNNRCAVAVDSYRVDSPITAMRSQSDNPSNIYSILPDGSDKSESAVQRRKRLRTSLVNSTVERRTDSNSSDTSSVSTIANGSVVATAPRPYSMCHEPG